MHSAPGKVLELIDTFDRNIEAYKSQPYNEAQLRREFLDPFFEQLGWDVTNKQQWAPPYREVIHEDAIKVASVIHPQRFPRLLTPTEAKRPTFLAQYFACPPLSKNKLFIKCTLVIL